MDRRDQEALSDLQNQLGLSCLSVSFLRFSLFSIPTKLKRTRPAPLVEDIDGRDEVLGEDERVVASDEEAEWTVSDPLVPMEIEGVVAESTARRVLVNPRVLEHRRAGLLLKAMRLLEDEGSKRAALPPLTAWRTTRCGPTRGSARWR